MYTTNATNDLLNNLITKAENEDEIRMLIQCTFKLVKENLISPECKKLLSDFIKNKADSENLDANWVDLPELSYTYLAYKMCKEGICGEKNLAEAKKYLLKMVKHRKHYACKELLLAYRYGNAELGIAPDKEAMIEWCFKMADYKAPTYLYFVALQAAGKNVPECYDFGVEKDLTLAIKCLNKLNADTDSFAIVHGEIEAILNLTVRKVFIGYSDSETCNRAKDSFLNCLSRDFWDCTGYFHILSWTSPHLFNLEGIVYYELEDYENAARAFKRASCYDSLGGRLHLSDMYSDGIGIPQDKEKAFYMKKRIADAHLTGEIAYTWDLSCDEEYKLLEAVEYVAKSYRFGIGVQQSSDKAAEYYSAVANHSPSIYSPDGFDEEMIQRASTALKEMGYRK